MDITASTFEALLSIRLVPFMNYAMRLMSERKGACVVVVNNAGLVEGILTSRDLLRHILEGCASGEDFCHGRAGRRTRGSLANAVNRVKKTFVEYDVRELRQST